MSLQQEWYLWETKAAAVGESHHPISFENSLWNAVCTGDLETVQHNCRYNYFLAMEGVGRLSKDELINFKYHFVISAALIARKCVSKGMEMEQAFRLSDFYILKLDNIFTLEALKSLHDQMLLDYTGKMKLLSQAGINSQAVADCMDYIYSNLHQRITVEELSEHTGLSPSHLSRLFKKEIGVSVSDYIREKKIAKAQDMLRYGNYSLAEISYQLAFASQSHFTQQFRDFTGMTPKQYRDLHRDADKIRDRQEDTLAKP